MGRVGNPFPDFPPSFYRDTGRYRNSFSELDTDQESVVMEHLMADEAFVDSVKRSRTKLQASFTALDPSTGNILAGGGGMDYGTHQFDHGHRSGRQPGPTSNPFSYAVPFYTGYI